MKYILFLFLFFTVFMINGQATVGTIVNTDKALDGYTFFSPFSSTKAFLVDNCGNLINEWDRGTRPGLAAYLLENGLMLRTYKLDAEGPFTSASNAGGIELVDYANNTIWHYEINTTQKLSHHDAVYMPNGNVLTLTWELTQRERLIELGRNPDEIAPQNFMWSEKIIELKPIGTDSAEIVWTWHINDHYIQDFDETKEGYGVVAQHPELFDINLPDLNSSNSNASRDWNHFNAIDYNEALDQILISVRNSDEIWIIDHSTTTEEAASHEGGTYGKGGDILYRWGNPSAYKGAPENQQMLWGQHGAHWVKSGLENEGNILIYNNGNGRPGQDFSEAQIIIPTEDSTGFYNYNSIDLFGPTSAITVYGDEIEERFYSAFLSNVQALSNGNFLINQGSSGRIFEINDERQIVWEYEIPLFGDSPITQGQNPSNNSSFRAYKYGPEYAGLQNVDLTPGQPIELNPLECMTTTNTKDYVATPLKATFDKNNNTIRIYNLIPNIVEYRVVNTAGILIQNGKITSATISLNNTLNSGLYVLVLTDHKGKTVSKKIIAP